MNFSYLDNSATTPVCRAAYEKMQNVLENSFGNPSSLHKLGMEAEKILSEAREKLFTALGAKKYGKTKPQMLIFTSSGTEANNLALIGTATAKERRKGGKIIVGETEHPSVIEAAKHLASRGFKVAFIPSPNGVWDMEKYRAELTSDTILVSAMLVNNETGAINDIAAIASLAKAKSPDVLIHCDAVQGFLKTPESLASLPADLISVSSHKIGGPKGVGALFIREKVITTKSIAPSFTVEARKAVCAAARKILWVSQVSVRQRNLNSKTFPQRFRVLLSFVRFLNNSLQKSFPMCA